MIRRASYLNSNHHQQLKPSEDGGCDDDDSMNKIRLSVTNPRNASLGLDDLLVQERPPLLAQEEKETTCGVNQTSKSNHNDGDLSCKSIKLGSESANSIELQMQAARMAMNDSYSEMLEAHPSLTDSMEVEKQTAGLLYGSSHQPLPQQQQDDLSATSFLNDSIRMRKSAISAVLGSSGESFLDYNSGDEHEQWHEQSHQKNTGATSPPTASSEAMDGATVVRVSYKHPKRQSLPGAYHVARNTPLVRHETGSLTHLVENYTKPPAFLTDCNSMNQSAGITTTTTGVTTPHRDEECPSEVSDSLGGVRVRARRRMAAKENRFPLWCRKCGAILVGWLVLIILGCVVGFTFSLLIHHDGDQSITNDADDVQVHWRDLVQLCKNNGSIATDWLSVDIMNRATDLLWRRTDTLHETDETQSLFGCSPEGLAALSLSLSPTDLPATSVRFALATFFFATGGPAWVGSSKWLSHNTTVCRWEGISCDYDGRVTSLNLLSNNLRGTIPANLFDLSDLRAMILSRNPFLTGTIPSEVGKLSYLETLDFSVSSLGGPLPTDLGNLRSLEFLDINGNDLTGTIPSEVENLKNLVNFNGAANRLCGKLPSQLSNLDSLEVFIVRENQFTGFHPRQNGFPVSLVHLKLSGNDFSDSTLPSFLWELKNLKTLDLQAMNLEGTIPVEGLANVSNIEKITLGTNEISGTLPSDIGILTNLAFLSFQNNELTGTVPSTIGLLTKLTTELNLANNRLEGTLPSEINMLSNLFNLDLSGNRDLFGDLEGLCASHDPSRMYKISKFWQGSSDAGNYITKITCSCCQTVSN